MRSRHRNRREARDTREGCLVIVIMVLGLLAVVGYWYVSTR